jgi:anti-sigma regulatory factor (Ser/Thr protein kinase)
MGYSPLFAKDLPLVAGELGVIEVRQEARLLARELGFDPGDQTRIAAAVSEVARLCGPGRASFHFVTDESRAGLECTLTPDEERVREGPAPRQAPSPQQVLSGVQRLVDDLEVRPSANGATMVTLRKWRRVTPLDTQGYA